MNFEIFWTSSKFDEAIASPNQKSAPNLNQFEPFWRSNAWMNPPNFDGVEKSFKKINFCLLSKFSHYIPLKHYYFLDFPWWFDRKNFSAIFTVYYNQINLILCRRSCFHRVWPCLPVRTWQNQKLTNKTNFRWPMNHFSLFDVDFGLLPIVIWTPKAFQVT